MSNSNTKTISLSELRRLRSANTDLLLLDVLSKQQFGKDHIEGAKNAPFEGSDFLPTVARAAGSKSKKIVVYCSGESCKSSHNAAQALTAAGYTDVLAYEGGIAEWRSHEKIDRKDGAKDHERGGEAHHAAGATATAAAAATPAHHASRNPKPAEKPAQVNTGGSVGMIATPASKDLHGKKQPKASAP
jgi:rhodanese-related sulfurtransferase